MGQEMGHRRWRLINIKEFINISRVLGNVKGDFPERHLMNMAQNVSVQKTRYL